MKKTQLLNYNSKTKGF